MPMYDLIEYCNAYLKTSGRHHHLWQYYRDESVRGNNAYILDFPDSDNNSILFLKKETTGKTGNGCTKDVEIIVPLKYLSNFWRTLDMPLVNFKIIVQSIV